MQYSKRDREANLASWVNAKSIAVISKEIARNTIKSNQVFARIEANTDAITQNAASTSDLEEGLAAVGDETNGKTQFRLRGDR